jgi:hypothetical protein
LQTKNRKAEVAKLVSRGVREGKIPPSQREFWSKQGMSKGGLASLKEYLATAIAHVATKFDAPASDTPGFPGGLTRQQAEICSRMTVSGEAFQKQAATVQDGATIITLDRTPQ